MIWLPIAVHGFLVARNPERERQRRKLEQKKSSTFGLHAVQVERRQLGGDTPREIAAAVDRWASPAASCPGGFAIGKGQCCFLVVDGQVGTRGADSTPFAFETLCQRIAPQFAALHSSRGEVSQAGPSGQSTTRLVCRFPERGAVDLQYQKLLVAPWVVQISATYCEGDGCLFLAVQNSWHGEKDSTLTAHTKEGLAKVMGSVAPPNKPGFPSPHSAASASAQERPPRSA